MMKKFLKYFHKLKLTNCSLNLHLQEFFLIFSMQNTKFFSAGFNEFSPNPDFQIVQATLSQIFHRRVFKSKNTKNQVHDFVFLLLLNDAKRKSLNFNETLFVMLLQ